MPALGIQEDEWQVTGCRQRRQRGVGSERLAGRALKRCRLNGLMFKQFAMALPFYLGKVNIGVAPLHDLDARVPARDFQLKPAISVRHVGRPLSRPCSKELDKECRAPEISVELQLKLCPPERVWLCRQHSNLLL